MSQPSSDQRSAEQIREHYEVEKELAAKLRNASKAERRHLYSDLYNELFQRIPHHTQLTRKVSVNDTQQAVAGQIRFLRRFLNSNITFLEVGPGDCALSFEACKMVKKVYAVDVSSEITKSSQTPANFELILSDGCNVAVAENSVDVAYSNQLMEHLHPDDAMEQLKHLYKALAPGGVYICNTPNRLSGPHDVSRNFDEIATGFHLKEYTNAELAKLFNQVGFSKVQVDLGIKGTYFRLPPWPFALLETVFSWLPYGMRAYLGRRQPMRAFLGLRIIGVK